VTGAAGKRFEHDIKAARSLDGNIWAVAVAVAVVVKHLGVVATGQHRRADSGTPCVGQRMCVASRDTRPRVNRKLSRGPGQPEPVGVVEERYSWVEARWGNARGSAPGLLPWRACAISDQRTGKGLAASHSRSR
jgi:hypothetical protein